MVIPLNNDSHLACGNQIIPPRMGCEELAKVLGGYEIWDGN